MIYVGALKKTIQQVSSNFFVLNSQCPLSLFTTVILILISFPTALGLLCSGSRPAALLLPGSILLDVSGGHTALPDGSPGL